jgi:hypothetical protein
MMGHPMVGMEPQAKIVAVTTKEGEEMIVLEKLSQLDCFQEMHH